MGGNALSQETVRLKTDVYERVKQEVGDWLLGDHNIVELSGIPHYTSKESHGDVDFVVLGMDDGYLPSNKTLTSMFGDIEIVRNGPYVSFGYKSKDIEEIKDKAFQVDLIASDYESHDFATHYYSYNDLGNLLGRVANSHGFKLGHNGFFYKYVHAGTPNVTDIRLTTDWEETLQFLGYQPYPVEGFDTLEEIFEYVASSEYFHPSFYALENLNATNRVRNRKRSTYMAFLQWIERTYPNPAIRETKDLREDAFVFFPRFQHDLKETVQDIVFREQVKKAFNGNLVSEWTLLNGKDLGKVMEKIRGFFAREIDFQLAALYDQELMRRLAMDYAQEIY